MSIPTNKEISKVTYEGVEIPLPSGSGSPEITTGEYVVRVIDYDGTVLKEQWLDSGATFTMPSQPSHSNLIFQEWSSPVDIVDNKVTVTNSDIIMGAVYTTASGLSEFDIVLTKVTGLNVTLNMDGTKNWGDGTSDTLTTHTYADYGDYTITCDGTTMTTSSSKGLFGQISSVSNCYCKNIRLANVTRIGSYAFGFCYSLTNITIPNSVTSISSDAFRTCYSLINITIPNSVTSTSSNMFDFCYSLTNITIPNSVTSINNTMFNYCYSLTNITIPNGVTSIGSNTFKNCYYLTNITIPNSVTSISSDAFRNCYSLTKYDFSEFDTPPTLQSTDVFGNINQIAKILVKDQAALTAFQTATNWSTYADYMYIKE